jgi:hypothetical protein
MTARPGLQAHPQQLEHWDALMDQGLSEFRRHVRRGEQEDLSTLVPQLVPQPGTLASAAGFLSAGAACAAASLSTRHRMAMPANSSWQVASAIQGVRLAAPVLASCMHYPCTLSDTTLSCTLTCLAACLDAGATTCHKYSRPGPGLQHT